MTRFLLLAALFCGMLLTTPAAQAESVECTCQQEGIGSCDSTFISENFIICTQASNHKDLEDCEPLQGIRGAIQCLGQGNVNIDEWTAAELDTPPAATSTSSTPRPQSAVGDGRGVLINPMGTTSVIGLIGRLISWFGIIAGALFFLYLLWGGAEWMMAGGDGGDVKEAKGRIVAAVAGIAVILFAYILVSSIIGIVPQ